LRDFSRASPSNFWWQPMVGNINSAGCLKTGPQYNSGIIQCDGYAVYEQLANPARHDRRVTLAFCWLHWRHSLARRPTQAEMSSVFNKLAKRQRGEQTMLCRNLIEALVG
jgi:Transposase IS66 family